MAGKDKYKRVASDARRRLRRLPSARLPCLGLLPILNDFALEKSSDLLATILIRSVLPRAAGELAAYAGLFRYFAQRTLKIRIAE
ncbi:hypothetical protein [Burkholderia multivorans]|uniref:hypothetical protein n=1 Tax=Burkholderia multivorans TaxID=87883 RepID=UPI0011B29B58|nr:hypothetical protein [Burkholderia multivorans]MBU9386874.1 hypothetical protein [Burkholderia multivorans]MBY4792593.1 hypothetical protein [Burkholderia multivorans]